MNRRSQMGVIWMIMLSGLVSASAQAQDATANQSVTRAQSPQALQYMHGRLSYRKKTADGGFERGREHWSLTQNRDGSRTMRTLAMTDDSEFVRDVTFTLDADGRPLRVFEQLQVGNLLVGSGYFSVNGDTMTLMTDGYDTGHTIQTIKVPERFHVLTHAVMLDGWPFWAFVGNEPGHQTIDVYSTSPLWNGTTGPLGHMVKQRLTFVGNEEVTVPAGTFQTRHFSFGGDEGPEKASHVYVTGEHNILVKYDWPPYEMEYLLESLIIENPAK